MSDDKPTSTDIVVPLTPANEAGERLAVRKMSDGTIGFGTIAPVEDGKPIPTDAEVLALESIDDAPTPAYRVTESSRSGPAKVTSPAYRANYDSIFGAKQTVGSA